MLAEARSLYAIGPWGRLHRPAVLQELSFTRPVPPAVATLNRVFRVLDVAAFDAALAHWAQQ